MKLKIKIKTILSAVNITRQYNLNQEEVPPKPVDIYKYLNPNGYNQPECSKK